MKVLLLFSNLMLLALAPRGLPNPWKPPSTTAGSSSTFHRNVDLQRTAIPSAALAAIAFTAAATAAASTAACAGRQATFAGQAKKVRATASF
eukprot:6179026-Pleurochrysis_carterae.AAC.2